MKLINLALAAALVIPSMSFAAGESTTWKFANTGKADVAKLNESLKGTGATAVATGTEITITGPADKAAEVTKAATAAGLTADTKMPAHKK